MYNILVAMCKTEAGAVDAAKCRAYGLSTRKRPLQFGAVDDPARGSMTRPAFSFHFRSLTITVPYTSRTCPQF